MSSNAPASPPRRLMVRVVALGMLLGLLTCSRASHAGELTADNSARGQLSVGYSLIYEEADGIPKLRWLLMLKQKSPEMAQASNEIVAYYRELANTMRTLARDHPAMRIDAPTMPDIEAQARKAIGVDMARDFAPLVGKTGPDFEREVLLTFYNGLNEQRHLVGVMLDMETDPPLRRFLQATRAQMDAHYARIGSLLRRQYFTH